MVVCGHEHCHGSNFRLAFFLRVSREGYIASARSKLETWRCAQRPRSLSHGGAARCHLRYGQGANTFGEFVRCLNVDQRT